MISIAKNPLHRQDYEMWQSLPVLFKEGIYMARHFFIKRTMMCDKFCQYYSYKWIDYKHDTILRHSYDVQELDTYEDVFGR